MKAIIKQFGRSIKRAADKIFGTLPNVLYWKLRHVFDNRRWAGEYFTSQSLRHPIRTIVLDTIRSLEPFREILEVGCASGSNLYLLSNAYPDAHFSGIDVSAHAIATGTAWLEKQGVQNVSLSTGYAWDLRRFPDKSIDISFTSATLIYVGPEKIDAVISELVRVTRKAIFFIEYHRRGGDGRGEYFRDHWVRDYRALLARHIPGRPIAATPLPKGTFGGDWDTLGFIIEVPLEL